MQSIRCIGIRGPGNSVGWLNTVGSDYRIMVNTGPFDLIENDPVTIIVGYTIGQGSDALNSVTIAKQQSQFVQQFYQSNFDNNLVSVEDEIETIPSEFALFQNFPNPFNSSSVIKYSVPKSSPVTLKIFNTLGEEIETLVNEENPAGTYELNWNAANLPSGVYFYRLQAGDFVQTRKMILLK